MVKLEDIEKSIKELVNEIKSKKEELKQKIIEKEKMINEALDPSDHSD